MGQSAGDRSLWLDSNKRVVTAEGKTTIVWAICITVLFFSGRVMNMGDMSLMESMKEFRVQWQLSWEGDTFPEDSKTLSMMTFGNGRLKVEPPAK